MPHLSGFPAGSGARSSLSAGAYRILLAFTVVVCLHSSVKMAA
ncbi:MAG: hypothetical protein Q7U12_13545 [Undibacterium sp.]|nr:hypothetical protein [Undibacterium sp.]